MNIEVLYISIDLIYNSIYYTNHIIIIFKGGTAVSNKARILLLDILRVISRIFPDSYCSELLSMPSLIEYATVLNTNIRWFGWLFVCLFVNFIKSLDF